jgi:U3 small nucleolar RNA-associated protein 18
MRKKAHEQDIINGASLDWAILSKSSSIIVEKQKKREEGKNIIELLFSKKREEFEAVRVPDANVADPSSAVISAVDFCAENKSLLLTAGFDRKLRLFDIEGKNNLLTSSTLFTDLPLRKAKFSTSGRVILSGTTSFLYVYDIAKNFLLNRINPFCSKVSVGGFSESSETAEVRTISVYWSGKVVSLFSSGDYTKISTLHVNEDIIASSHSDSGRELFLAGGDGKISTWDLRKMRCMDKKSLSGTRRITALANSSLNQIAIGDCDGIVSVIPLWKELYNNSAVRTLKPSQKIESLRSTIDGLTYNSDGSLLSLSSSACKDSLRMAHQPSGILCSNWPTSKTPLNYVFCSTFSKDNQYLAFGNARGRVLLYRLNSHSN